jgi:hypothetical protein
MKDVPALAVAAPPMPRKIGGDPLVRVGNTNRD